MQHLVFISYAQADSVAAERVCSVLETEKIKCWMAPRDISSGDVWAAVITDAIEHSKVFVVLLSAESNASQHVIREIEIAVNNAVKIIPFRLEDVPYSRSLKYFLNTVQWINAFPSLLDSHLAFLLRDVRAKLPQEPEQLEVSTSIATSPKRDLPDVVDSGCVGSALTTTNESDTSVLADTDKHHPPSLQHVGIEKALERISVWEPPGLWSVLINWDEDAWRELRREAGTSAETVVRALCLLVREPTTTPLRRFKAVVLLGWAIRSPELRAVGEEVLQTFKHHALKSATTVVGLAAQKYAWATCDRAAMAIVDSPLASQKWRVLAEALQDCECANTVLELLPQITPVGDRLESANLVKEALLHSRRKLSVSACVDSIKKHGKMAAVPCLRAILRDGDLDDARHAGHVLAEWDDTGSVPDLRVAIENWRFQRSPQVVDLVESLHSLDESICDDYLPYILKEASPVVQKEILDRLGTFGNSHALLTVITELSVTAGNEEIRIASGKALRDALDGQITEDSSDLT